MVRYLDNNSGFNQWAAQQAQKKPSRFAGFFWWVLLFLFAWWIMGIWFKPQNTEVIAQQPVAIEQSNANKQNMNTDEISMDVQGLRISNIKLHKHHINILAKKKSFSIFQIKSCQESNVANQQ